jgi:uncharacterized protein
MNEELIALNAEETIAKINSWLNSKPDIIIAFVYGSLAEARFHAQSDVDLAVLGRHAFTLDERVEFAQDLGAQLNRTVDLVDLSQSHGLIAKEIFTNGLRVKNSDPDLLSARLKRFYLDEADYGRFRDRAYKERRERVFGT